MISDSATVVVLDENQDLLSSIHKSLSFHSGMGILMKLHPSGWRFRGTHRHNFRFLADPALGKLLRCSSQAVTKYGGVPVYEVSHTFVAAGPDPIKANSGGWKTLGLVNVSATDYATMLFANLM